MKVKSEAVKKEKEPDSPKPGPYGHSRGLPQSFTRSQKERPLLKKS
jgi:hypothetical protein